MRLKRRTGGLSLGKRVRFGKTEIYKKNRVNDDTRIRRVDGRPLNGLLELELRYMITKTHSNLDLRRKNLIFLLLRLDVTLG